jgi:L-alanine-DL-glutamate epimerase-like enolase superfamily enzyme
LIGERADDIAAIRQRIREVGYLGWRTGWIEPACWDAVGRARGVPVYELLGGRHGKVELYASTGQVRSGKERAAEVEARLREGFRAVKLRVHDPALDQDVAQLRETRAAVGDQAVLGVDANQGWRVAVVADAPTWDPDRASAFCKEAEQLGYAWVEEPLPMDAYADLAALRASVGIDIAGGELNGQGLPEFQVMLEKGCFDVYQPDATFTGGIAETWRIVQAIRAAGARYTPHTWTNGIGFAVNLQLFAASPRRDESRLEYPYDPPGWVPEARDGLLVAPWLHEGGSLALPTAPGLGVEIDPAALRRYGTHFYRATKVRVALAAAWDRGLRVAKAAGDARERRLAARRAALAGRDPVAEALTPPHPAPGC